MQNNRTLITIVILIALVGLVGWFLSSRGIGPGAKQNQGNTDAKSSGWQAVFLTNGQVYFGKLADGSGRYVTLRDIYYLQLAQAPQSSGQNNQQQQQTQISLVKLGNELHGPLDEMKINRDHILFIENMKNDAKVVAAIDEYVKKGPNNTQQTQSSPTAAASPSE